MTQNNTTQGPTQITILNCLVTLTLIILCWPAVSSAQGLPQLVLEDSRGNLLTREATIGLSLLVGLEDGIANHSYEVQLLDGTGSLVASVTAMTDTAGSFAPQELWHSVGIYSCGPGGGDAVFQVPDAYQFPNLEEASVALDGQYFSLVATDTEIDVEVVDQAFWLASPNEAEYYWSDALGNFKCFFETDEDLYLSVFKGETESWQYNSRVYMFEKPAAGDWVVGMSFVDARSKSMCDPDIENCDLTEGTETYLPSTKTVLVDGDLPDSGEFLAIIRPVNGWDELNRHGCDRVTENSMFIGQEPDLLEDNDGWGCPPCPP